MTLVPVAVLEDDPGVRDHLASQLGSRAEPHASLAALEPRLTGTPMVIVLGPSCASASRLAEVSRVLQSHREVGTVPVVDELSTDLLQTALRAGVGDVLAAPVDSSQLEAAVTRVAESLDYTAARVPDGGVEVTDGGDGNLGQVVTVFSTKGGAGKSVIAANPRRGDGPAGNRPTRRPGRCRSPVRRCCGDAEAGPPAHDRRRRRFARSARPDARSPSS